MKLLAVILVSLAIAGGGLWLAVAFAIGTTSGGCPAALLQGTLVEQDGTLAVESIPPGRITRVTWPFGYSVGIENGTLAVTRLFSTVAREGDEVSVGGGMAADNITWAGCGQVTLGLLFPPEVVPSEPARATLTVTGTAYEPCIPPPSGCGYWVSLTSDAATPVPLENGSTGYPPRLSVACTKRLVVPVGATAVTVDVTYAGSTCDVTVRW